MSVAKLVKYLEKNSEVEPGAPPKKTLILVSDSKGCKLRNNVTTRLEQKIVFQCKPGRTTLQAKIHIQNNIQTWIGRYKKVLIVLWTGTCDLTSKTDKFIDLQEQNEDSVLSIISEYENISSYINEKHKNNADIIILEVPQYSIEIWNSARGHEQPTQYKEHQEILIDRINRLNDGIRRINSRLTLSVALPRFGLDLQKTHKSNKKLKIIKYAYGLLTDGIHAGTTLSKYWLRQIIIKLMLKLCY